MQRSATQQGGSSPRSRGVQGGGGGPARLPLKHRRREERGLGTAAVILVVGVNVTLYLVLGALRTQGALDASRMANLAWRDRALAAEGTAESLAEQLSAVAGVARTGSGGGGLAARGADAPAWAKTRGE